ncbi:MAG: LCP family protein [Clostridium sp.]|jgi:LCP family protein required for cell wall assembly|nr:LCP family protein [Clostridium sp.]
MGTRSDQRNEAENRNGKKTGKKGQTAKQKRARRNRRVVIFGVEILVLLGLAYLLFRLFSIDKASEPNVVVLDKKELGIAEQVETNPTLEGYWNIALFGVDAVSKSELYKASRSDSIMIASVNKDTGDIKLVSVYRDTYLDLGNKYSKITNAYSYGGAEQAIKALNTNLDLDIEDFVTVGYQALSKAIDGLGGVYIEVDSVELKHINNYQIAVAEVLKTEYVKVEEPGMQLLNGLQATAYCRIRYTAGDDFKRAERQREVLKEMEKQAKKASLSTLVSVFESIMGDIYTSLNQEDVVALLGKIMDYQIAGEGGFPQEELRADGNIGGAGAVIVPYDLESNVLWLHRFLFEDESYEVSDRVKEINDTIVEKATPYLKR